MFCGACNVLPVTQRFSFVFLLHAILLLLVGTELTNSFSGGAFLFQMSTSLNSTLAQKLEPGIISHTLRLLIIINNGQRPTIQHRQTGRTSLLKPQLISEALIGFLFAFLCREQYYPVTISVLSYFEVSYSGYIRLATSPPLEGRKGATDTS